MNWSVGAVFHMSGSFAEAHIRKQWRSGWWRRSGLGGTHALYSWQCFASAEGSEAHIPCSVAFPNAAQLGACAYCISGTYWGGGEREIHNFVKVVDHNLPLLLQNHHHRTLIALIDTDFMHISGTAVFLMHMWKGSNLCLPTVWCPSFG